MADDTPTNEMAETFRRWESEISYAQKDEKYRRWIDQSEKIVKRYRDERRSSTAEFGKRRYNILWSNVQTLAPAVYGKMPKPYAERRFLDRDPVARLASTILERVLAFQMDTCGFHESTDKVVLDYLLPGMGQLWLRYEPTIEAEKLAAENDEIEQQEEASEVSNFEDEDDGDGTPYEKVTFERVCFGYVYYRDFLWGPARCWAEVQWVAKRCWQDKSEATEAFGKEIADRMVYGDPKNKDWSADRDQSQMGKSKKAEVWEIWNKPNRCVYFISPESPDLILKEVEDDPLKLEGFWPCPEPLFATQTNDTLVPVPDYIEYQDQAQELDNLTQRIAAVTTAVKAAGVYDASQPALQRLLQDGQDNKLIPVDQMAVFSEKGGMPGAIALLPMQEIIEVLLKLYEARDHVKQDLYEITGMSDILRGATDAQETATAQKIKANYATGRLGARQERVAEFCASVLRIASEIVSEVFSAESLMQMSGIDQMNKEAIQKAVEAIQPPRPPPPPQQGQPPIPPEQMAQMKQQAQEAFERAKREAAQQKQKELNDQFQAAVELLRNDKLRGFRVDIETDSTIADDMQNDKASAVELITGVMQSLEAAGPIIQAAPEMAKPLGGMMMWAYRKYRVGRTLEASLEDALAQIDARIELQKKQPPQPSPEAIQAQADVQVSQAKAQSEQVKAQAEQARGQADVQLSQAKLQTEQVKMQAVGKEQQLQAQIDALTLQLDAQKAANANQVDLVKAKLSFLQATTVAMIAAGQATDAAALDAKIETILGYGQMQHEQQMQANDQAHEAAMAASDQAHQQTMQENAPEPAGP